MRVQRAPLAADQPQRPPAGLTPAPSPHPAPAGLTGLTPAPSPHPAPAGLTPAPSPHPGPAGLTGQAGGAPAPFSAEVSLDLTGQCRQLQDPVRVTAVVIAGLLAACRTEGLLEESWTLCVLRPTADGVLGTFAGEAVGLSADGIAAARSNLTPGFAAPASPAAMTSWRSPITCRNNCWAGSAPAPSV